MNGVLGDTLWRTGANAATQFTSDADLVIAGQAVPAGTYTLWTHTTPDGSYELVINKQTKQWGTDYHADQDLVRVPFTKSPLSQPVEKFTITLEPQGSAGTLKVMWGNQALWVPVAPR